MQINLHKINKITVDLKTVNKGQVSLLQELSKLRIVNVIY